MSIVPADRGYQKVMLDDSQNQHRPALVRPGAVIAHRGASRAEVIGTLGGGHGDRTGGG